MVGDGAKVKALKDALPDVFSVAQAKDASVADHMEISIAPINEMSTLSEQPMIGL